MGKPAAWTETCDTQDVLLGLATPLPTQGRVAGYVKVPHSTDISAYGMITVPIVIIANGDGPTALLLAGSHGDEFEGQIALSRLAQRIKPSDIKGRVIILPMANMPAARAGRRNSPIDGLDLNRIYPGDVRGSPTAIIANYIERQLMAESDIVVDLQSGGRSIHYMPCITFVEHTDAVERARRLSLAFAFGAPNILAYQSYEERGSSGAAKRAGATRIGAEIGATGAGVDPDLVTMIDKGLMRLLRWSGIIEPAEDATQQMATPSIRETVPERDYVFALNDGVFEPATRLGDVVSAGDLAGRLHDPSRPWQPPVEVRFSSAGTVVCQRALGLTERGDVVAHLATDFVERFPGELAKAVSKNWIRELYSRRRPRLRKARSQL